VVKDAKYESVREEPHRVIYRPYLQTLAQAGSVYVAVRGTAGSVHLAGTIRQAITPVSPDVPIETFAMDSWVNQFLTQDRLLALLSMSFGLIALVLAAVGLYGMLAYTVTQRAGEIGIRIALGAHKVEILRLVLREAVLIIGVGTVVGASAAVFLNRTISSMLFELTPADTVALFVPTVIMLTTGLVAAYVPARRASQIDPMSALRNE
jgi:putative ABC transport system permease protein